MAANSREINCGRKGKRGKRLKWTRQETMDLVSAWKDMSQLFKTFGQRKPFYEEISKKLIGLGHNRSTEQCQTKMNRIKYMYRRFKMCPESDKQLPFCENIEEMLDECYMSGDECSDDCLEGNNAFCPALYVQAELKLSPERKQDDDWEICTYSLDVLNNKELDNNLELSHLPSASVGLEENDASSVSQKSKIKSEIWTHNETLALISEWKKIYGSSSLKKGVYEDLSNTLASHGYVRTAEQCQRKMSNLKVRYKKQQSNGNADWPYYHALHEFLGKQVNKCTTCTGNRINVEDNWTSDETDSLISIWKQLNSALEKTVIRTPIYEKMSNYLTELGFKRNAEECQQKVIQLKILYRQISYNTNYFDESWPYYDAVHEIMSKSVEKVDVMSKYTPFLLKKTLLLEYANESNVEKRTPLKECRTNGAEQTFTNNYIENKFHESPQDCSLVTDGNINDDAIKIERKNLAEPRKILPKSPLTNITATVQQQRNTKQDDIFINYDTRTNQAVPSLETVLLIVPSSSESSISNVSKCSNLAVMPQAASESGTSIMSSDTQQTSVSWPTLLLIPITDSSTALQNKDSISLNIENC